jgi:thymidylate synthase
LSAGTVPVVTTKQLFWKLAIAEMLGYIRVQTRWQTRTMNKIRVIEGHNFTPVVNTTG